MAVKQVLIVDDEPDIRELLELTLGRMDLETRAAADVKEAKQFLKDFEFDLCLTDMRLPDGNGIDLVRDMQETHPDLPVAVITEQRLMHSRPVPLILSPSLLILMICEILFARHYGSTKPVRIPVKPSRVPRRLIACSGCLKPSTRFAV